MENSKGINDWIPLITKLVWPLLILLALIIFNKQVSEVYTVVMTGIKEGRNVEIGGFLKLGEKASNMEIGTLSADNISIDKIGGEGGVVRKGTQSQLEQVKQELKENPTRTINTMLLNDDIRYSVKMLKEYASTLGLKYVVFQENGSFSGWMSSSAFIAQLPDTDELINYSYLKEHTVGINMESVMPTDNARDVLWKMQELHIESLPVVNEQNRWMFFTNRGEILSSLMTSIMLEKEVE